METKQHIANFLAQYEDATIIDLDNDLVITGNAQTLTSVVSWISWLSLKNDQKLTATISTFKNAPDFALCQITGF